MMKAFTLILSLTFCFFSCSTQRQEVATDVAAAEVPQLDLENYKIYNPEDTTVTLPVPTYLWERDSIEALSLNSDKRVIRKLSTLQFALKNGTTKTLLDNELEGDDYVKYTFIKSHNDIGQWQVLSGYYEGLGYLLIDQNDGTETPIWSDPAFSPDKKYFMCALTDIEAGFVPNGIQLWTFKNGKPSKVWEKELSDWGVEKLIWTKDNYIIGEQVYRDEDLGELNTRIVKMKLTGL